MYDIFLPAVVLLIAAFYGQYNARVLSAYSPSIQKVPDGLAERDWSSDPESIFIAKDGEGCLIPVPASSKSKRENTNSVYDFSEFIHELNPGTNSNSAFNNISPLLFDQTTTGTISNSESNHFNPLLFDKTNSGANSNADLNRAALPLSNDATIPEENTLTSLGNLDSGFPSLESAGNSPLGGHSLDGSAAAFSNNIPGSTSNVPSDVQRDTADIAQRPPIQCSPYGLDVYLVYLMTLSSSTPKEDSELHQAILVHELGRDWDIRYDVVHDAGDPTGLFRYRRVEPFHWISPVTGISIPLKDWQLKGFIVPPPGVPKALALKQWDQIMLRTKRPFPAHMVGNCQSWCQRALKNAEESTIYVPIGPRCTE